MSDGRSTGVVGERVVNSRVAVQVEEFRWLPEAGSPARPAREGHQWLAIAARWESSADPAGQDIDWASMRVRDGAGAEFLPAPNLGAEFLDVHPWTLSRNQQVRMQGEVAFEVPPAATGPRYEMAGVSVRLN
jgi:hypothetical protein